MTPYEPKIISRDGALVAITPDGERPADPDGVFDWHINIALREAWSEGFVRGYIHNSPIDMDDEDEIEMLRDRAEAINPYEEEA